MPDVFEAIDLEWTPEVDERIRVVARGEPQGQARHARVPPRRLRPRPRHRRRGLRRLHRALRHPERGRPRPMTPIPSAIPRPTRSAGSAASTTSARSPTASDAQVEPSDGTAPGGRRRGQAVRRDDGDLPHAPLGRARSPRVPARASATTRCTASPNPDTIYRNAAIDGAGEYRISGRRGTVPDVSIMPFGRPVAGGLQTFDAVRSRRPRRSKPTARFAVVLSADGPTGAGEELVAARTRDAHADVAQRLRTMGRGHRAAESRSCASTPIRGDRAPIRTRCDGASASFAMVVEGMVMSGVSRVGRAARRRRGQPTRHRRLLGHRRRVSTTSGTRKGASRSTTTRCS